LDIFEDLFDGLGGCAMIAIVAGIILLILACVAIGIIGFGVVSWM
jgi:hypothetical protein